MPYGEGVTYWALAEIVKAQAGIGETDSADETKEKLRAAVAQVVGDPQEEAWIESHLRPLAGVGEENDLRADRRGEAFAAWRRFFEALAARRPLVLVFEDLQWGDDGLLDFADELVTRAENVPLLVLCTARPELLERRPGWGGGKRNAAIVSLGPLTDDETAALIDELLQRSVVPADVQAPLVARSGGNPLYAEQYVRMLSERGDASDLPLPATVQGIIAARLDGLPRDQKSLLQDAAVIGKVFWEGAVVAIGGIDRESAREHLLELEQRELVRASRRSSITGESEFFFPHLLVPDVAYNQIPRAQRAEKHRLAAEWLDSLGRPEDHAEMIAHHYSCALELARAARGDFAQLVGPARPGSRFAERASERSP